MFVKQRLEFRHLQVGQIEDIGFQDRAQLDVAHAARLEYVDLFLRVG